MAVYTILMDFSVKFSKLQNDEQEDLLTEVLENYFPQLVKVHSRLMEDGGYIALFTAHRGSFITSRLFPQGLLNINIEYYKNESDEELITSKSITMLEKELAACFGKVRSNRFPPLRRGDAARYFSYFGEFLFEYDTDALVFEEMSPYQKVQIFHSKTLGNMLVLDGVVNLSNRDLIYTETLMQRGKENYEGKEIIILGGGDGALLHELLKENPKMVLMFELDEVVIRTCREHMRECCGNALDKMKGVNYEIIVGDCMQSLEVLIREGRKFDYVFGDLTDVPVTPTPQNEVWDFITLIISTSFKLLKPQGKYMTHCCKDASAGAWKMFEEHLMSLNSKLEWSVRTAFIPAFFEDWLFYQVSMKDPTNSQSLEISSFRIS